MKNVTLQNNNRYYITVRQKEMRVHVNSMPERNRQLVGQVNASHKEKRFFHFLCVVFPL